MKIIETPKRTYLANEIVELSGGMSQLNDAIVIGGYDGNHDLAFKYFKAILLGKMTAIKIKTQTIESIEDAEGVIKIIKKLEENMPEAKRRAEVKATIEELANMLNMSYIEDDDED
jgi:molybdopterin converting factor small subunit